MSADRPALDEHLLGLLREAARDADDDEFQPHERIADSRLDSLEVMEVVAALRLTPAIERELFGLPHDAWRGLTFGDLETLWKRSSQEQLATGANGALV